MRATESHNKIKPALKGVLLVAMALTFVAEQIHSHPRITPPFRKEGGLLTGVVY